MPLFTRTEHRIHVDLGSGHIVVRISDGIGEVEVHEPYYDQGTLGIDNVSLDELRYLRDALTDIIYIAERSPKEPST